MSDDFDDLTSKWAKLGIAESAAQKAIADLARLDDVYSRSDVARLTATESLTARVTGDLAGLSALDLANRVTGRAALGGGSMIQSEVDKAMLSARMAQSAWADVNSNIPLSRLLNETTLATARQREMALQAVLGNRTDYARLAMATVAALKAEEYLAVNGTAVMGPLAELRAAGALDNLATSIAAAKAADLALVGYESRFKMPGAVDFAFLGRLTEAQSYAEKYRADILTASARVHSPWLDVENPARSALAFADLQVMGRSVVVERPYSDQLMDALRLNLGDWRDTITMPVAVIGNLTARSAFYVERGFRAELTDFPAAAFEEALEVSELTLEAPTLVDRYGEPIEPSKDEDVSAFMRTNKAHLWFLRLETQLRAFINESMTREFGPDWPRHRLPNGMYDEWVETRRKNGKPTAPLIDFADFTHYVLLMTRRDNWKLFKPHFKDEANLRESMQRLYLARNETSHARPISQDDEVYIYVEIKRLWNAIKS